LPQSEAATSASGDPTQGSSPSPTSKTLIACALAVERGTVIPVIRDALDELLGRERERHKSELVGATRGLAIAKREAAASALELALATKRGKVLDLPNPLKSVN
jgi:hypothetical protein